LAACKLAGAAPIFGRLTEGQDLDGYVLSANVRRRNLDKGQQAMAIALAYPDPAKLRRKGSGLPDLGKTEQNRLSMARTVLRDRDAERLRADKAGGDPPVERASIRRLSRRESRRAGVLG
jgi:hypothetical protein